MDATTLKQKLENGSTTAKQLAHEAIAKIKDSHDKLNATVEILEAEAENQLSQPLSGALAGLPISIKECYAIKGKAIRSGSVRMKPIVCNEDAAVVRKLKNAGAVIVARGNTSEFLLGRETDNQLYGTTNNVINPALTAGGSSGGDASLVASNCVEFAVGTDIGGSCRYPALFNGIVGFKPASGQIDKEGIFPMAGNEFTETMNSPGILCRSVRDARLVYNVIGNKQLNAADSAGKFKFFTASDFMVEVKDESIEKALNESINFLKSKAESVNDMSIPESGTLMKDFVSILFAGFADEVYKWSVTENGKKLSFPGELINRMRNKPTLSDEVFSLLVPFFFLKPSSPKLDKIIQRVKELRDKYNSLLGKNGILILPTAGVLALPHSEFRKQINKPGIIKIITPISFCNILNLSCITIPAWTYQKDKNSNPPGVQLITASGNEELLLNTAELLEAHLQK